MMNLLFCGNKKVFDGLLFSILSILKHTKTAMNVHVFTMDLTKIDKTHKPITDMQITFIRNLLKEANVESKIQLFDMTKEFYSEMGTSVNLKNFYTPYSMLRLFADVVPLPDKILYLDTDIVAMDDIQQLYELDIREWEFAGAVDYLGKIFKNVHYINSGVLLLNLKMIKETNLFGKARNYCTVKKMAFPDQDALNRLSKKKRRIPTKYNSQRMLHEDTIIRHFCKSLRIFPYAHTVNVKPWETDRVRKVLKITYLDDLIEEYQNVKEQYNQFSCGD